jgi:hypothetical protein
MVKGNYPMDMSDITTNLHSFEKSASLLFDQRFILPGLALLYTGIDIVASLERLAHEGTKVAFVRWCNDYLVKRNSLSCTSTDLYAARCGILHTYTAESDLSRAGKAKKVFYAWGTATARSLKDFAKYAKTTDAVYIHVDDLREAFRNGVDEWAVDVEKYPTRRAKVVKKSSQWFTNLPKQVLEDALEAIPK